MATVKHTDERVEHAFNERREARLGHDASEWRTIATAGLHPNETDYMRVNLEDIEYPGYHRLHPRYAYKVTMHGRDETGIFTGQKKSLEMRAIVKASLELKQNEFRWIMVSDGGSGHYFRHTWYIFTEDELRSAVQ